MENGASAIAFVGGADFPGDWSIRGTITFVQSRFHDQIFGGRLAVDRLNIDRDRQTVVTRVEKVVRIYRCLHEYLLHFVRVLAATMKNRRDLVAVYCLLLPTDDVN